MVGNVGWNEMNTWEDFYRDIMGFANLITFDDKDISTQYTALMSKVMTNGNGRIKFPINEGGVLKISETMPSMKISNINNDLAKSLEETQPSTARSHISRRPQNRITSLQSQMSERQL